MFIKKVEIFGFKSFKNKTVLEFDNHEIAGIVGPNGCGKSNVVEALLWVMGESSPKHLRGESLADIIFGGTIKESPGNLAEVTLTLNQGGTGFPEDYKNFSELMITRRSYRDGKNEYFINQQVCLLRDIREFFMNTGAGCRGFSIIEQSAIEKLITAKPAQRRFIIEEVAGITKFKSRKSESVRKLDLVNQNLQRLDDILKIQESQLSQLTNQAKQAEEYRKLKRDIESRKKQIEKREQEDIFCAYQNLKTEQDSLKIKKAEKEKKNQAVEKRIEEEKASLELTRKQEVETRMKVQAFEMIETIKGKKQALKEKEKTIREELRPVQDFFKDKVNIEELEREAKRIRNQLEEIKQSKKSAEIGINISQKQIQFIEKEQKNLLEEKKGIQAQIQKNINDKNKASHWLHKQEQMSLNFDKELDRVSENEKILENKKQNLDRVVTDLYQTISALKCKRDEMQKLISRFEAVNEGATDLSQWRSEEFQPLFRSLKVAHGYSKALASVLGHHIQALIPKEGVLGIEQAVQRLKSRSKGKTSFLSSLPGLTLPLSLKQEIKTYPAFVCFLDEQIVWNVRTKSLRSFLGQTAVVSDLSSAFKLKKQFPSFQFVTKEGDLITRDSLVYAGSSDKETSLFHIRDQIDECSEALSAKEIGFKIKKLDLESCIKQLKQVQQQKQDLRNQNTDSFENLISVKKDRERMEQDILRLLENRKTNDQKMKDFDEEKQNLIKHEEAYNKEIHNLSEVISLKESRFQVLEVTTEDYKTQNLKKLKWDRELLENKKDQQSLDQEVSLLLNLTDKSQRMDRELEGASDRKEELDLVLGTQKQKLDTGLVFFQNEWEQYSRLKEKQEKHIADREKEFFQIKEDISRLELDWDKQELEKTYLKNKFLENYQLQIENFAPSSEEIPFEKLKEEVSHYERQLERIKEVNFLALEEYEKLSKENFFLNEQKEDLVNSKKEIMKVISRVDKLCDTRFNDMLEEINKRFSKIFPIVFQGDQAKAQLILCEEPEDKESGVDILIHPPGKRPQSVSLLSRGEKALTSICLIYSLFLVKPSPFCIIDEADAPLDDANILRFLSVLKEMSRKSQIIVITHNKYTMQACRKLYGVTMERPGISQIVSVDMKQSKELPTQAEPTL